MLLTDDPVHAFLPYPAVPVAHAGSGPLSGLTLAVKDIFDVAGYPTGCGQPHKLALSGIKTETAPVVQRLLQAGAFFVGKTHTVELAFSLTGANAHFGTPLNPSAPLRLPGGSSSGSAAAVAANLCDIGLGSDTGGSVRVPASYCGLFGIRPTHGRLSMDRSMPLAPSLDTVGWMTRDSETFLHASQTLLEPDPHPLPQQPRLLWLHDLFRQTGSETGALFQTVFDRLRETGSSVALTGFTALQPEKWLTAFRIRQGFEAWASHGSFIQRYRPALGPGIAERFAFAQSITRDQYENSLAISHRLQELLSDALELDGVILLPTVPDISPLQSSNEEELEEFRAQSLRLLALASLTGCPQITLPLLHRDGAPLGLSLLGPKGSDLSLVRLANHLFHQLNDR
jgi:amidase